MFDYDPRMSKRTRSLAELEEMQATSLGYLLIRCAQRWGELGLAAVNREAGTPILREAHTRLLPHLTAEEGIRITDLARVVGVTKQAAQPLVAELAELGAVRIERDPEDARARRVFLTDFGVEALMHGAGVLQQIEAALAPRLGERGTTALKKHLAHLLAVLDDPSTAADFEAAHARALAASPPRRIPRRRAARK